MTLTINKNRQDIAVKDLVKRQCITFFTAHGKMRDTEYFTTFEKYMRPVLDFCDLQYTPNNELVKLFAMEYCLHFDLYKIDAKKILSFLGHRDLAERDTFNKFNYVPAYVARDNMITMEG